MILGYVIRSLESGVRLSKWVWYSKLLGVGHAAARLCVWFLLAWHVYSMVGPCHGMQFKYHLATGEDIYCLGGMFVEMVVWWGSG